MAPLQTGNPSPCICPWLRLLVAFPGGQGHRHSNATPFLPPFEIKDDHRHLSRMSEGFDPADYSVVVKLRGTPPQPWRWEIYRAGRWGPLESSPYFFSSMAAAAKDGKKALARLLAEQAA
jgi:hypothetical protein